MSGTGKKNGLPKDIRKHKKKIYDGTGCADSDYIRQAGSLSDRT